MKMGVALLACVCAVPAIQFIPLIFNKTYLPTKQQVERGVDRQERCKMDEYEERTLSVIAPEQEVRFVLLPAEHILCLILPSFEIQNSSNVSTQFRSSSQALGVPAGQFVFRRIGH